MQQHKVRINDLARELEVKSREILEVLPKIGITEKKTHSSSIEEDEAERVKKYFAEQSPAPSRGSRSSAALSDEFKPRIDLSHISKPGDVLKAITQRTAPPPAPARPTTPPPRPVAAPPSAVPAKPAPAASTAPLPAEAKPAPRFITPQSVPRPPAPIITPPRPPSPPAPSRAQATQATQAKISEAAIESRTAVLDEPETEAPTLPEVEAPAQPEATQPATLAAPAPHVIVAPARPGGTGEVEERAAVPATPPRPTAPPQPAAPVRRLIVPQTGPRPVYTAPVRPVASTPPRPVMPERGKPIFQRPRPGMAPTGAPRPPLRPGERRGPHPTRSGAPGARPGFAGGPGVGAPPPPTGRPMGRPARPGQRYVPRGVKEGPMKGFVPPPRLSLSSEPLPITRSIEIPEGISVKDLAEKLGIRAKDLIARLLARGVFATVNQTLDSDLASGMARHFGAETSVISFEEQLAKDTAPTESGGEDGAAAQALPRPPVVTIMGHVDHGKTSLLDAIRSTNVAEGEAGGITQHIGAYKVAIVDKISPAYGRQIVFLDTPGHEAFTRMRARGAKATDIVVLVVAADDGVMPQTLEAIDHAHAAEVPIIVAVNKIDKPDAMPERVKKQLADRGLMPEDWGGTTVFVDVSAKQRTNLNLLMEMICLVADLQDLKANPERPGTGTVVEAKVDRGRGVVATVLVQNGTLRVGDSFIVGNTFGKVRAMFDDRGKAVEVAPPSTPVEVLGLEGLPQSGDVLLVADREKARQIAEYREQRSREATLAKSSKLSLEGLAEQIKTAGMKELPIILKADVQGSSEVLADTMSRLSNEKVKIKILHTGVGAINENDVLLASASNAVIIGFNVRPERKAQELADMEKIDIRLHSIIYELQDQIKKAMLGLLDPIIRETYMGRAEVRETFRVPKAGTIAGCYVLDGSIKRDSDVRLVRDGVQVYKGKIGSLKRFKDDASEVRTGMECGINLANFNDVKKGDLIE